MKALDVTDVYGFRRIIPLESIAMIAWKDNVLYVSLKYTVDEIECPYEEWQYENILYALGEI